MFVDSHCHLDMLESEGNQIAVETILNEASTVDVGHFLCVSVRLDKFLSMYDLVKDYPQISVSVGLHPTEETSQEPTRDELAALANRDKIVAIGETGLDYYRVQEGVSWQKERFVNHIQAAHLCKLPLIIHTRQAQKDTIDILAQEKADVVRGVMHCFTEDWEMAKKALDLDFYISFSGILTFKNALQIQEVAQKVPLDRILIETDAPFLAPVPFRGKPNQPAYVRYVAEFLAQLRGEPLERIEKITTENFFSLFNRAMRNDKSIERS